MDRILALQGLTLFSELEPIDPGTGTSTQSGICSLQSSAGAIQSTCSIKCGGFEQMEW
jgi:hypothetical protein